jgi:hypothetical protein
MMILTWEVRGMNKTIKRLMALSIVLICMDAEASNVRERHRDVEERVSDDWQVRLERRDRDARVERELRLRRIEREAYDNGRMDPWTRCDYDPACTYELLEGY